MWNTDEIIVDNNIFFSSIGVRTGVNGEFIYHYAPKKTITKILKPNNIVLRLTHIDDFDDKMEGKAFEVYYDLALEKLLRDKKIDESTYGKLAKIKNIKKDIFTYNHTNDTSEIKFSSCDIYVACFSLRNNDEYMIEQYAKENGVCISFIEMELNDGRKSFGEMIIYDLHQVYYGEDIVSYIYKHINANISNMKQLFPIDYNSVVENLYRKFFICTKLYKFHKENEVRLVIAIPKGYKYRLNKNLKKCYDFKKRRKCIKIKLAKSICQGVFPCGELGIELKRYLEKNNYRILE